MPRPLDPRATVAIDHLRANWNYWVGPIMPHQMPAALPPNGDRHSWRDSTTLFLLCELMGVHRVETDKDPYWRGVLYQIDRCNLAKSFGCGPDEISKSLQWLKTLGLVFVEHRTQIDGTGKPCGTDVYAVPRMDRIKALLDSYVKNGRAMTASELMESDPLQAGSKSPSRVDEVSLNNGSTRPERGEYLNCAQAQQKIAEGGGEASAQRPERTVLDDRRSLAADGGGEADADQEAQVADVLLPPQCRARHAAQAFEGNLRRKDQPHSSKSASTNGNGHISAPLIWPVPPPPAALFIETEDQKEAWRKASIFCVLWEMAITRLNWLSVCDATTGDRKQAYKFFLKHPQANAFFTLAAAIVAWPLADEPQPEHQRWDNLRHARSSREPQSFLRSYSSGKLQSEIGQQHITINAWAGSRLCFTESELIYCGWPAAKVPILALDSDDIWENDRYAPNYYRRRHLPLPPEVIEAEKLRQLDQSGSDSISSKNKK